MNGAESLHRFGRITDQQIKRAKTKPALCSDQRWRMELRRRKLSKKLGIRFGRYDDVLGENKITY